ncbi:hypothetical protein F8M41_008001 [Gigaspora margarita]|uniref:Uncharacterized protein n=1 Tax=Gigaspora margarita TaxID=4874 RepID=A0A8H4A2Y5_GIGMA|nr:hypothetical protein F8M41_008001 [Gigaspora margarita]
MSDLINKFDKLIENNAETQIALLKMRKDLTAPQIPQCELCDNLQAQLEIINQENQTLIEDIKNLKEEAKEYKTKYYKLNTKYLQMVKKFGEPTNN